ncbi:MAG: hypothetical protein WD771_01520 [Gemmatimonadaceae bacterium]
MTADLTHLQADTDGLAARFVAGTLVGDALARFEAHLLECAACQAEVEVGMTLRAAGASPQAARARWVWPVTGVAAAAALVLLLTRPVVTDSRLATLGGLDTAPIHIGIAVRSDERDARFDAAMQAYRRGDYARAMTELSALRVVADAPPVLFFLGASALMVGADSLARDAYDALLASPESAYHDEARYYRAKAHLRAGRAAPAVADLRAISDATLRRQADALVDSIGAFGIR